MARKPHRASVLFVHTVLGAGPVQFTGSFMEACEYVWRQSDEDRRELSIETPDRSFTPAEIEALRPDADV